MSVTNLLPTTAFIFARSGSKGVAGKNIRLLNGKPLITYAIEVALQSQYINRVVVSTDSEDIAKIAHQSGAEVPFMRPSELAQDDSPEWLAWQHAIEQCTQLYGVDACPIFVSVPTTCPLRKTIDIDRVIEKLYEGNADIVITTTQAHSNPYFTMVTMNQMGYAKIAAQPSSPIIRRQDAPSVMDIVGVAYAAFPKFVMSSKNLWEGKVQAVEVPQERALDIDTEHDFLVASLLMGQSAS